MKKNDIPQIPPMGADYGKVSNPLTTVIHKAAAELNAAEIEFGAAEQKLNEIRGQIVRHQQSCRHNWAEAAQRGVTIPGYTIQGDAPGTMGVDWRGPIEVPSERKVWWERRCLSCGLVERTDKYKPTGDVAPIFGH